MNTQQTLNHIETKKAQAIANPNQPKRICQGYYVMYNGSTLLEISQIDEGSYKGYWMVTDQYNNYSDPVETYKMAKEMATNR